MNRLFYVVLVGGLLGACSSVPQFKVEGEVSGAGGKMLYMEASALEGIMPMDSVKLDEKGHFVFKGKRPASPEFYRLRVEDKVINFSIDSTETLTFKAPYGNFSTEYSVEGSPNSVKIKELTLMQLRLQERVDSLTRLMQSRQVAVDSYQKQLSDLLNDYKNNVKLQYIYAAPNTAAAYFALFQKLNGYLIFDPLNSKDDVKCFAAVATSLNNYYPHADRSRNLYNIVIRGMKNTRPPRQTVLEIPEDVVKETGVIDVTLRDMTGNMRSLSDLRGKVVILDFTVYQSAVSASHNYQLRDLYDKYMSRGLEIYQVSLDADEHYWKTIADNLPWICVRDVNGIYSGFVSSYNVQSLPSFFLINRDNELSARGETIEDLEAAVKALL